MASIISIEIDVTKIDHSKLKSGKYYSVIININDESNDYGNNVSISENQSKEEREAKIKKNYLGNGRVIWNDGKILNAVKKEPKKTIETNTVGKQTDDLPF